MPHDDITGDELEQLLGNEQTDETPKNRVAYSQADDQGELGDLISQGVKHFTHSGDHVKSPGDLSIHSIRQAGHSQNGSGQMIVRKALCIQIDMNIYGD